MASWTEPTSETNNISCHFAFQRIKFLLSFFCSTSTSRCQAPAASGFLCAFGVRQPAFGEFPQGLRKGHQQTSGEVHYGGCHLIPSRWSHAMPSWNGDGSGIWIEYPRHNLYNYALLGKPPQNIQNAKWCSLWLLGLPHYLIASKNDRDSAAHASAVTVVCRSQAHLWVQTSRGIHVMWVKE
jgi:hypothetical protein